MSYVIICATALLVSGLTLFSGFGLGTLLMPAFALFFPIDVAVAATAVVHGANNIFKIFMVGRQADRVLVLGFGIPAILAALAGAAVLGYISGFHPLASYTLGWKTAVITPIKLVMGVLIFIFALFDLLPALKGLRFERKYLPLGGLLSGFFGGLSGHQGAMRSAFLTKTGVSPQAFVGTNAVIGFMVDMARITAYSTLIFSGRQSSPIGPEQWPLILCGTLAAFAGVFFGKRFLQKITMKTVQSVTGVFLLIIAFALCSGLV